MKNRGQKGVVQTGLKEGTERVVQTDLKEGAERVVQTGKRGDWNGQAIELNIKIKSNFFTTQKGPKKGLKTEKKFLFLF